MFKKMFYVVMVIMVGLTFRAEAKDLNVGILSATSGPWGFAGKIIVNATRLAAEDAGGVVKINGEPYNITFIEYDTKAAPAAGRSGAERLIFEDKVKFIIGSFTADTQAFQPVTEKNKVLILHQASGIYASPDKPYSFRSTMIVDAKYAVLYKALKKLDPSLKTIAFINPDNQLGELYEKFANKVAESLGYKVVATEFAEQRSSDYSPVLVKIMAKKPDIIDLGATGGSSDSALIIKQGREMGFKGRFVAAVGLMSKTVTEVAGPEAMNGVIETGFTPEDPALSPEFKKLAVRWKERFPKLPFVDLVSEVYDVVYNFFKFLDGQDTLDPEIIKDRYADYEWTGIYGKCYWGGEKAYGINRLKMQPVYFSEWRDGKPVIFTKGIGFIP